MVTVGGLYYSKDHEWVKVDGKKALIGITDYAQNALGEIVYVELPDMGTEYKAGDVFCVIESVKAAADSFTPVSGKVVEVNEELEDSPQLLNEGPYDNWIVAIEMDDSSELENLMDEQAYKMFCEKEE
ncbi:MAG: glycine cleavage system protein GcvH [Clostridia bacterium]|jgi:glycine cleavage system H protein|nr:glycine cleavage system protein GcvH [Clostridiales bacterium]